MSLSKEVIKITEEEKRIRADKFLALKIDGVSRNFIQGLFDDGKILINGKAEKGKYKLSVGDCVEVEIPEPEELKVEAEDIPLNIVYEDEDVIVVNKPKGMVVHPAPGNYTGTLVNALLHHCDDLSGINGVIRPGIVHRIDKILLEY